MHIFFNNNFNNNQNFQQQQYLNQQLQQQQLQQQQYQQQQFQQQQYNPYGNNQFNQYNQFNQLQNQQLQNQQFVQQEMLMQNQLQNQQLQNQQFVQQEMVMQNQLNNNMIYQQPLLQQTYQQPLLQQQNFQQNLQQNIIQKQVLQSLCGNNWITLQQRRFHIDEKWFSLGGTCYITDEVGLKLLKATGKILTVGLDMDVYCCSSGQQVGRLTHKLFSLMPEYHIHQYGRMVGKVKKKLAFFQEVFYFDLLDLGVEYTCKGDLFGCEFTIICGQKLIATVSKKCFL